MRRRGLATALEGRIDGLHRAIITAKLRERDQFLTK
jgi:hypothetical protein